MTKIRCFNFDFETGDRDVVSDMSFSVLDDVALSDFSSMAQRAAISLEEHAQNRLYDRRAVATPVQSPSFRSTFSFTSSSPGRKIRLTDRASDRWTDGAGEQPNKTKANDLRLPTIVVDVVQTQKFSAAPR